MFTFDVTNVQHAVNSFAFEGGYGSFSLRETFGSEEYYYVESKEQTSLSETQPESLTTLHPSPNTTLSSPPLQPTTVESDVPPPTKSSNSQIASSSPSQSLYFTEEPHSQKMPTTSTSINLSSSQEIQEKQENISLSSSPSSSSSASGSLPHYRDWNSELQAILSMPCTSLDDLIEKGDFVFD
jgi:hypothetical protein